jgi:hypothetical protein
MQIENLQVVTILKFCTDYKSVNCTLHEKEAFTAYIKKK